MLVACATAGRDPAAQSDGPLLFDDSQTDAMLTIDANNCTMQPCTILPQCGCASGAACDVDGEDLEGGACRVVAPTAKGEGEACSSFTQCTAGNVCLSDGVCRKYCDADADCGQPRGKCVIDLVNNGTPLPNVPPVCSSNCDPTNTAAGGCPAGKKCGVFLVTRMGVDHDITDCSTAGTQVQGGNCEVGATNTGNDALCAADFMCTTLDNAAFNCRRICNVAAPNCAGLTCIEFEDPGLVIGGVEYGVCN